MSHRGGIDWSALPVHPLLLAAYPVVYLFASNAAEQITMAPLWGPLAAAVGGGMVALAIAAVVARDWHRGALIASVLVIGFFGYGHAWNAVADVLPNQWPLIGAWALLVIIGLFVAWRSSRWARSSTRALNVVAAIALLLNAWSLAGTMVGVAAGGTPGEGVASVELRPPDGEDLPDVYYLVFDRYGGPTALADVYD
ncbi:MAG: hypothetical protein ACRDFY_02550, partial [Candidatus Limnocylindria bacterium]